jgi:hypothetical protein
VHTKERYLKEPNLHSSVFLVGVRNDDDDAIVRRVLSCTTVILVTVLNHTGGVDVLLPFLSVFVCAERPFDVLFRHTVHSHRTF